MNKGKVVDEMARGCLLMRTRLISRMMTSLYEDALRPFGIGAPQFVLLVVISQLEPASRAEIGRFHHQDRSTLTRNLKLVFDEGWAEEDRDKVKGRSRPVVLTKKGRDLLLAVDPVWRRSQTKAKALLGERGSRAVMTIADGILSAPAG